MNKISFRELQDREDWEKAVIVFTEDSFNQYYSEVERSYEVSSDAKYFDPNMIGNSLFGDCIDGNDDGVRLDYYMNVMPEEGIKWKIDYCYIIK